MKRRPRVYWDTSVISASFDRTNPERQFLTQRFFEKAETFETHVSEIVLAEINGTRNVELRNRLREVALRYTVLEIAEESRTLADE